MLGRRRRRRNTEMVIHPVNYEDMTVKELREIAKSRDITIPVGATKHDIVTLLNGGECNDGNGEGTN